MSTALLLSFIRKNDYHNTISIKKGTKNIVSSFGSLNSHHHHNHRYINILQQRNNNRIHYQQTQQWRNFISKMILISLSSISLLIVSSNTTDNSSVVDDDNITNNIDNGNITKNYNIQFFDRNNIWSIFHNINKTKFISTNHDNDITEAEELTSTIAETNNEKEETTKDNTTTVINWSGTHSVNVLNERYWEPNTEQEVIDIMKYCHENHISIRPTGSSLSPNGISLSNDGMINLVNIDELIHVDTNNHTVTVQAGARVSQVIEMLKEYHYTLPNLASIAEQQMGGFISISAHGTGAAISPIDHYVTKLKIVTPAHSIITLTEADGDIFHMMKVGLGCFGILLEITMKCIPAHNLVEHTYILTRQQAKEQCNTLLKKHKHIRYMWIPYTDTVIVVTNNPVDAFTNEEIHSIQNNIVQNNNNQNNNHNKVQPIIDFLIELDPNSTESDYTNIGFGELRDRMLSYNPLNINHVKKCNEVEALFWKNSTGYQIRPSDELLQFDCGGQVRILYIFCLYFCLFVFQCFVKVAFDMLLFFIIINYYYFISSI